MANWISLIRSLLCLVVAYLLFQQNHGVYLACFVLTIIVIWMDGLDGYIARKFNESSKTGAVIDILGDRIVEQVYWVTFMALGWVELWMVLVILVRGILVDGLRGMALEKGYTAFGTTTMMESELGKLLVASNTSRWLYAFVKAAMFAFLILGHTPGLSDTIRQPAALAGYVSMGITLSLCVVRGLPVLIEGRRFLKVPVQS